jgi:hypothetical protein
MTLRTLSRKCASVLARLYAIGQELVCSLLQLSLLQQETFLNLRFYCRLLIVTIKFIESGY